MTKANTYTQCVLQRCQITARKKTSLNEVKRPKAGRRLWLWPVEYCPVTARLSFAFEKEVTNFLLISLAFCRIISAVKFRLPRRDFPQRLFSSPQSEVHSVAFSNRLAGARPTLVCNRVTKRLRQQSKLISVELFEVTVVKYCKK